MSFAGVIAFIYSDLVTIPVLNVYRKYYGWKSDTRRTPKGTPDTKLQHKESEMMWFWIVFLVLLVLAVPYMVRMNQTEPRQLPDAGGSGPSAEEILEQRYARGEIDSEEFEQKKRVLRT